MKAQGKQGALKQRNFSLKQPSPSAVFHAMGPGAETVSLIITDQNTTRDPRRTEDPWCSRLWPRCLSVPGRQGGRQAPRHTTRYMLLPRSTREVLHSLAPAVSTWVLQLWRRHSKTPLPPKRVNTTRYSKHSIAVVIGMPWPHHIHTPDTCLQLGQLLNQLQPWNWRH